MSDPDKKERKHWLDHATFYNAIAGFLLSVTVAVGTWRVEKEAAEDRKLQWRPVLSLNIHGAASGERDPLGVFLENAGKGPARIEATCVAGVFDAIGIPGLAARIGGIRPGAVIAAGETIAVLTYTPEGGKGWSDPKQEDKVLARIEQSKQWGLTIHYSSLYTADGCFVLRRSLSAGQWSERTEPHPCGDLACTGDEQPFQ